MQPALPFLRDRHAPAVPRRHVGEQRRQRGVQRALPEQAVVGEQHGFVDAELGELGEAGRRLPVVARQRVVVALERRQPAAGAAMVLADLGAAAGHLHLGDAELPVAPAQARRARRVVLDAQRLVAQRGSMWSSHSVRDS